MGNHDTDRALQRAARELARETGQSYTTCLRIVKARQADMDTGDDIDNDMDKES